ncbi:MAG: MaoC family dehydratase [Pseudobdellovibrionaceae bacterium]
MSSMKLNSYSFEELYEGLRAEFNVRIDEDSIRKFAALSGDENPLHTNSDFARSSGFSNIVAHGAII